MGVGPHHNYTDPTEFLNNPFIIDSDAGISFIPDLDTAAGRMNKFTWTVKIKWARRLGEWVTDNFDSYEFFGVPPQAQKDSYAPVLFTPPYFDCGHSDRWIYAAVSPIVDFMPRYSPYNHIRKPQFVGVSVIESELTRLDINPCPRAPGNPPPNRFEGTARCKATTMCEPLFRWGLQQRGGYKCMCKPGYRYPYWQQGPFLGIDIEQATEDEYRDGFDCIRVQWRQIWPYHVDGRLYSQSGISPSSAMSPSQFHSQDLQSSQHPERKRRAAKASTSLMLQRNSSNKSSTEVLSHLVNPKATKETSLKTNKNLKNSLHSDSQYINILETDQQGPAELVEFADKPLPSQEQVTNALSRGEQRLRAFNTRKLTRRRRDKTETAANNLKLTHILQELSRNTNTKAPAKQADALPTGLSSKKGPKKERYRREIGYRARYTNFDSESFKRAESILSHKDAVDDANCHNVSAEDLWLPGDVSYGADYFFENQAHSALRLAHFLSAFLQLVDSEQLYGNFRGDRPLNAYQLFGEVLSTVMSDLSLLSYGAFFARNAFTHPNGTRLEYFAQFAYKDLVFSESPDPHDPNKHTDQSRPNAFTPTTYYAVDYTGFKDGYEHYTWFSGPKERWASNTYGLKRFLVKPFVRADIQGSQQKRFEQFPMYFYGPTIEDGMWSAPYYDCVILENWVISYSVPFFGTNKQSKKLEFRYEIFDEEEFTIVLVAKYLRVYKLRYLILILFL